MLSSKSNDFKSRHFPLIEFQSKDIGQVSDLGWAPMTQESHSKFLKLHHEAHIEIIEIIKTKLYFFRALLCPQLSFQKVY